MKIATAKKALESFWGTAKDFCATKLTVLEDVPFFRGGDDYLVIRYTMKGLFLLALEKR